MKLPVKVDDNFDKNNRRINIQSEEHVAFSSSSVSYNETKIKINIRSPETSSFI